jgi:hypothetical protein
LKYLSDSSLKIPGSLCRNGVSSFLRVKSLPLRPYGRGTLVPETRRYGLSYPDSTALPPARTNILMPASYFIKCFLIIDLKAAPLTHQDIGQMDMYARYFEDKTRQETDNPTIGLILCTEKDKTIVKYSLLSGSSQIFASKYMLYLPTEQELKKEILFVYLFILFIPLIFLFEIISQMIIFCIKFALIIF